MMGSVLTGMNSLLKNGFYKSRLPLFLYVFTFPSNFYHEAAKAKQASALELPEP
jgi:hypothetical protein